MGPTTTTRLRQVCVFLFPCVTLVRGTDTNSRPSAWPLPRTRTTQLHGGQTVARAGRWERAVLHGHVPEHPTPRRQVLSTFPLKSKMCLPPGRGLTASLASGRRSERHAVEQFGDSAPFLPSLDVLVPLMGEQQVEVSKLLDVAVHEQVVEVPKIFVEDIPSPHSLHEPQLAEQLVEVREWRTSWWRCRRSCFTSSPQSFFVGADGYGWAQISGPTGVYWWRVSTSPHPVDPSTGHTARPGRDRNTSRHDGADVAVVDVPVNMQHKFQQSLFMKPIQFINRVVVIAILAQAISCSKSICDFFAVGVFVLVLCFVSLSLATVLPLCLCCCVALARFVEGMCCDGYETQRRSSRFPGKERAERVLAEAITIDCWKEWICKFCSETNVLTRWRCKRCFSNIPAGLQGKHKKAIFVKSKGWYSGSSSLEWWRRAQEAACTSGAAQ